MAKVRTRMPNIFVGHPFGGRFALAKFRQIFKELPFNVIYGNTHLQTEHLLAIMKRNISKADYAIYDLSDWNPNVALELGLSEGLKTIPSKQYYIVLNTRRSKEVPSDIRGLQRIEYTSYDFKKDVGLGDLLIRYILVKEYWFKRINRELDNQPNSDKKKLLAVKIVAHLRDHDRLTPENVKSLSRGTRLRRNDSEEVLNVLYGLRLIKKLNRNSRVFVKRINMYKKHNG
jgi:hypothetical protein